MVLYYRGLRMDRLHGGRFVVPGVCQTTGINVRCVSGNVCDEKR